MYENQYVGFKITLKINLDLLHVIYIRAIHEIFMKIYSQYHICKNTNFNDSFNVICLLIIIITISSNVIGA